MSHYALDTTPSARYWALLPGGYPDTLDDYASCASRDEAVEVLREAAPYMAEPAIHVFAGTRAPWLEHDAYPDYVLTAGPRGGVSWERA